MVCILRWVWCDKWVLFTVVIYIITVAPHIVVGLGKIILISENGTIDMSEMKGNGKNQDI